MHRFAEGRRRAASERRDEYRNRTRAVLRGAARVNNTQRVDEAFPRSKCSTLCIDRERCLDSFSAIVRAYGLSLSASFPGAKRCVQHTQIQHAVQRLQATGMKSLEKRLEARLLNRNSRAHPPRNRRTAIPSMCRVHSPGEEAARIRATNDGSLLFLEIRFLSFSSNQSQCAARQ